MDQKPTFPPFPSFPNFSPSVKSSFAGQKKEKEVKSSSSSRTTFTSSRNSQSNLSYSSSSSSSSSLTSFTRFQDESNSYHSSFTSNRHPPLPPPQSSLSLSSSSSSSSSGSKSLSVPQWKHDVFVSFRGEDTRHTFVSLLYRAFAQAKISFFRDDDQESLGRDIDEKLIEAIHNSRIALIVFSKGYNESSWCLNELIEILECNKKRREEHHSVIPIFYDVEPEKVREVGKPMGFAIFQLHHKTKRMGQDSSQIEKWTEEWKDALVKASKISGFNLKNDTNGDESKFVQMITTELSKRLKGTSSKNFTLKDHDPLEDFSINLIEEDSTEEEEEQNSDSDPDF